MANRAEELITQLEAEIAKRDARIAELEAENRLLEQEIFQQPSAGVVLPERMPRSSDLHAITQHNAGWNSALDEVARLNPCRAQAVADGYALALKEPVAAFGHDCIFNLRKQPNGERWPAGTKLYTAPPASADAVSVPVELLERLADMLANPIHYHPGAIDKRAEELRALLARSESEGVKS